MESGINVNMRDLRAYRDFMADAGEKIRALVSQVMADVISIETALDACTAEEEALFLIELGHAKALADRMRRRGEASH